MVRYVFCYLLFLSFSSATAMIVGNPANPGLLELGIIQTKPYWCSFRAGYFDDWVYKQDFEDEFKIQGEEHKQTFMKLSSYSAILTFNIANRGDFYGLIGSSRMQIDKEVFTKRALGWGIGSKVILFKQKDFFIGGDIKYFETNQKPRYFIVDHQAFNIESNYRLKYSEVQAALGISYRTWIFAPYANATYLITKVEPVPAVLFVRLPDMDEFVDVESKSIVSSNNWGVALGLTLFDSKKVSLSCEWRGINQNAIDVSGEIRF